jgi:hypothetical protein
METEGLELSDVHLDMQKRIHKRRKEMLTRATVAAFTTTCYIALIVMQVQDGRTGVALFVAVVAVLYAALTEYVHRCESVLWQQTALDLSVYATKAAHRRARDEA